MAIFNSYVKLPEGKIHGVLLKIGAIFPSLGDPLVPPLSWHLDNDFEALRNCWNRGILAPWKKQPSFIVGSCWIVLFQKIILTWPSTCHYIQGIKVTWAGIPVSQNNHENVDGQFQQFSMGLSSFSRNISQWLPSGKLTLCELANHHGSQAHHLFLCPMFNNKRWMVAKTVDGCKILRHQTDGWNPQKVMGCLPPIN